MSVDPTLLAAACFAAAAASHTLIFRRPAAAATVVETQRGTPNWKPRIPECPCAKCKGLGKTVCGNCNGFGRVNFIGTPLLPKGVAPQWCPYCRASGRWYCERCMGTGVRRDPIGFRLSSDK